MLGILFLIGLGRVWYTGITGQGGTIFLLVLLPLSAIVFLVPEMLRPGPVVMICRQGIFDRRNGRETVPWDQIEMAEVRRKPFIRTVKIVLVDQSRYDIDLMFIDTQPEDVMRLINTVSNAGDG